MGSVFRLSISATLQMLISMTSYIGVMRILSAFGSAPLAGYTIGFRVLMFALLPAFGLANAAATLVGQNLGAKRPDRAEAAVWRACLFSAAFLSVLGVLFVTGAGSLVGLFTSEPEVRGYGVSYLRIVSLGFPFYAFGMVVSQSFNGAGDTRTPTLINFLVFWVVQMPLAWALSHDSALGPRGVFITLLLSFSIFAVVSVALFRRGAWKRTRV
jgi:Na+-driven multidrug efflux pump